MVDATVSPPALIEVHFESLSENGHELVLFDINKESVVGVDEKSKEMMKFIHCWATSLNSFTLGIQPG